MLTFRLRSVAIGPAALVLLVALPGCAPAPPAGLSRALPPTPQQVVLGADGGVDRNKVLEAGRKQEYDDNPGASDQDVLDEGVIGVIEPQVGVYGVDSSMLARGIVVARFRDLTEAPLKRLSLVPGLTTFWYIYRKKGKLFSAYVVDSPDPQSDQYDIPTMLHPPTRRWWQSIAQWQMPGVLHWDDNKGLGAGLAQGGLPWVTCTDLGCCKPAH